MLLGGFLFGLGAAFGLALLGLSAFIAWGWWERRHPEPFTPDEDEEPELDEDPRPEWMKARNGKPYDPTAGYEPKRRRTRRSGGELTTPPET